MAEGNAKVTLQVLICTYGPDGMERLCSHVPPEVGGVEWIVSWQTPEVSPQIPAVLGRPDIKVRPTQTRGLSVNRNHALSLASAPYILIADDDLEYNPSALTALMEAFRTTDADIICCRYTCRGAYAKAYGEGDFPLRRPPKGWYVTSFEIAARLPVALSVPFNERLGIGNSPLIAGEESLWLHQLLKDKRVKALGLPIDLCEHPEETTGQRLASDPRFAYTQGALLPRMKPLTWWLRLPIMARRSPMPALRYLRQALPAALRTIVNPRF